MWSGIQLDDQAAIVIADRSHPRLLAYVLGEDSWQAQQSFPGIGDVLAVASPSSVAGTLLLWAKDAGDLQISRWENGRLTYPRPFNPLTEEDEDRRILALQKVGDIVWWAQRVGKDVQLYQWGPQTEEPTVTRFKNLGSRVDKVVWLAGGRLLFKERHAGTAKLAVMDGEATKVSQPTHLKKVNLSRIRLISVAGVLRAALLKDGALQWLGDDLHSVDQLMLPRGKNLVDYVATDENSGWALQENGQRLHRMQVDATGIARSVQSFRIRGGRSLFQDTVLGMMLVGHQRITQLSEGTSFRLKLIETVDKRIGQPRGRTDAAVHRVVADDVDGDGTDEVILLDDRHHQLTMLDQSKSGLTAEASWPVFEDKKYPYGPEDASLVREPRSLVALDVDGDGEQDLAMACHDRLVVYLADEKK